MRQHICYKQVWLFMDGCFSGSSSYDYGMAKS
jgi:hypothetical protein